MKKQTITNINLDAVQLAEMIHSKLDNHILTIGQKILLDHIGTSLSDSRQKFIFTIDDIESLDPKSLVVSNTYQALFTTKSEVIFETDTNICIIGQIDKSPTLLIKTNWDFSQMGVGGLDAEFSEIFRRAFASRMFPTSVMANLGIKHIKGILLHGPPGTGKTLMARKIGEMLNAKSLKIINGPEILNQYVGKSEENIRNLFVDAEKDQIAKGDKSELHIIIFDEIDAICKTRGSTYGGTGVADNIVNQLLSKIEGVTSLNNILIIGMTNRKDMIDEALLRPGRLEVHIEIGLPDDIGRLQILKIHTAKMNENNHLDGVDLQWLASKTKNYTGAELEGLVKNASSYAFARQLDITELTKKLDPASIKITHQDFVQSLGEINPAFGASIDEFDGKVSNGIIDYGIRFQNLLKSCRSFSNQVLNSNRTLSVSFILEGSVGCGKTALATTLAIESNFPFIKMICAENMLGLTEHAKCQKIIKVFQDSYKSPLSVIVLDDIERLLEYVPIGHRFSNAILQTLLGCLKKTHSTRKLLVIGTTNNKAILEQMQILSVFNAILQVPDICPGDEMRTVLKVLDSFDDIQIDHILEKVDVTKQVPIRTIIMINEMVKQNEVDDKMECFIEFIKNVESGSVNMH